MKYEPTQKTQNFWFKNGILMLIWFSACNLIQHTHFFNLPEQKAFFYVSTYFIIYYYVVVPKQCNWAHHQAIDHSWNMHQLVASRFVIYQFSKLIFHYKSIGLHLNGQVLYNFHGKPLTFKDTENIMRPV